jgi:hypothetical protein
VVSGNRCERGSGGISQGVFFAGYNDLTVTGNVLLGTMYNGISFSGVKSGVIAGNFLLGYVDMGTQIIVRGGSDNITIDGNAAPLVSNYNPAGDPANTNITIGTNTVTTAAAVGDNSQLAAWQVSTGASVPPPVVTPPPVTSPPEVQDPLQPALDAATAQITTLTNKLQVEDASLRAAQAQVTTLTAKLASAPTQSAVDALNASIASLKAQLATLQSSTTAAALKAAQASLATANNTLSAIKKAGGWK